MKTSFVLPNRFALRHYHPGMTTSRRYGLVGGLVLLLAGACTIRVGGNQPPPAPMVLVQIPAGSFSRGCATGDSGCRPNENARQESVHALRMDATDVTAAQYRVCVMAGVCKVGMTGASCTFGQDAAINHPMNCLDWSEASTYCAWAAGRLPPPAEWEYAAKSGRDVIYPWGNEAPDGSRAKWRGDGTDAVDAHPAGDTPWGLKDMAGNVWQWTAGDFDSRTKEIRGGSWGSKQATELRASNREGSTPDNRRMSIGFRCVR
jgi:formylglycine-generating enzyme required for sulfatase activity